MVGRRRENERGRERQPQDSSEQRLLWLGLGVCTGPWMGGAERSELVWAWLVLSWKHRLKHLSKLSVTYSRMQRCGEVGVGSV